MNRFVYVKDYELPFAFVKSPVQVGASNDRFVEVLGGLIVGDEVVTNGAYSLAFAGKGSVSLKEALDAAHGHEHNEDGSEVGSGPKTAKGAGGADAAATGPSRSSSLTAFSLGSNVLLLALLLVATRRRNSTAAGKA